MTKKPTDLELAKALYDLTTFLGILPSKDEKHEISDAIFDLIDPIFEAHGFDMHQKLELFRKKGLVDEASERGHKMHLANKAKFG